VVYSIGRKPIRWTRRESVQARIKREEDSQSISPTDGGKPSQTHNSDKGGRTYGTSGESATPVAHIGRGVSDQDHHSSLRIACPEQVSA
jgi:hypothetical protein